MIILLSILFVIVCLLLIFMVVITPSQSEGLAGAFGGMGSDTFFGTKAHQHISKFTMGLAVGFLVLAVLINVFWMKTPGARGTGTILDQGTPTTKAPAPPTTGK
jgi:preprotein translocase subunit SecG